MPPEAALDLPSIVARTSSSYDALPYVSDPFPFTHPAALGAVARLFALDAAPAGEARVLELGCASGGNIIPMAARNPAASFVGVDLSAAQVAAGCARIARLHLANIELRCQNFADFRADGPFDYVICHGVYSWVPAPLRETILRICRQSLSPRGVAMISYNVLPGWRLSQALRDAFLLHVSPDADPRQRVAQVRELLALLPQACPENGPYRDFLHSKAKTLLESSDDYLVHEFLDDINEPCTVHAFADAASRHGLAFLAEAELPSMILANYPPAMAQAVKKFAGNALIATEQYIDMVSGRPFRRTLLVPAEREQRIDRRLASARIADMHVLGASTLALIREGDGITLAAANGRRLHTRSPPLAEALAAFVARFPGSASVGDLRTGAPAAGRGTDQDGMVREALFNMVINGIAQPWADRVAAVAEPGERPIACPMVRAEAAQGATTSANLRHEHVELGALAQFVLPLLDGSRDRRAIIGAIAEASGDGRLTFARNGPAVSDPGERTRIAADQLAALLPALARAALLLA